MGQLLILAFKLLVKDKSKYTALLVGTTFSVFLIVQMTSSFAGILTKLATLVITAAKLRLPEYASRVTFTNLGLAFLLVLIIATVSGYAGVRRVLKIEPFDIFQG